MMELPFKPYYEDEAVTIYNADCRQVLPFLPVAGFHDTPKPLKMIRNLLGRLQGETVLDPFMGSGTTLVAARLEGRKAVGIEISEEYCEKAAKRLAQGMLF